MIKKRELSDPNSCINRADADEPVFVLRANDASAPAAIHAWIQNYCFDRAGGAGYHGLSPRQKAKVDEAALLARDFERWRQVKSAFSRE